MHWWIKAQSILLLWGSPFMDLNIIQDLQEHHASSNNGDYWNEYDTDISGNFTSLDIPQKNGRFHKEKEGFVVPNASKSVRKSAHGRIEAALNTVKSSRMRKRTSCQLYHLEDVAIPRNGKNH